MSVYEASITNPKKQLEFYKVLSEQLQKEIERQDNLNKQLVEQCQMFDDNWNELKGFLEKEKERLARECSQIYEDSLGKTRLVNEDIYNEVKNISDKMNELEGKSE